MNNKEPNSKTRIKDINEDVVELKGEMRNNVRGVMKNLESLEPLVNQADDIRVGAKMFEKEAIIVNNETKSCCQEYCPCCTCCNFGTRCIAITIGFVGFFILAYFAISLIRCSSVNIACSK